MPRYIDVKMALEIAKAEFGTGDQGTVSWLLSHTPTADVAPKSDVIAEYRKKVYAKMGKYTIFGREYIQRIMREVEKEMKGGTE